MKTHWEATYYGTGMSPQVKTFDTEEAALEWWDANVNDPYAGVSSLKKVEVIRERT